jgi:hypothetical protein
MSVDPLSMPDPTQAMLDLYRLERAIAFMYEEEE